VGPLWLAFDLYGRWMIGYVFDEKMCEDILWDFQVLLAHHHPPSPGVVEKTVDGFLTSFFYFFQKKEVG